MSLLRVYRLTICKVLCAFGMVSLGLAAIAGPMVNYQLNLTVDNVMCGANCGNPLANGARFFGAIAIGQSFVGGFSVDSDILGADGIVNTAPIYDFRMPFGNALYSTGTDNMTLAGFRNQYGLGASAPGFQVANGNVVNFVGNFYGTADAPFVDFYSPPDFSGSNRFWAYDGIVGASGNVTISRIPEPAVLGLFALGLLGCGVCRRT